jgi:hypothetical protein
VNSSSSSAIQLTGSASITAPVVGVVGDASYTGSSPINGTFIKGAEEMDDPFASIPAPNLRDYTTSPDSGGTAVWPWTKRVNGGSVTLRPGVYWGGISITGSPSVTMQPGRYIMAGGGLSVSGSGSVRGTDVFIYNTQDPYSPRGWDGSYGNVSLTGSGTVDLKAPSVTADSTYAGLLIFNDRASTRGVSLSGSASMFTGYVYSKLGALTVTGQGSFGGLGAVVNNVTVTGIGTITLSPIDRTRIPIIRAVRLIE